MKRFVLVAALAGILVVALSAAAFAAPPTPQAGQSFGPGAGIHTPGTGLANGTAPAPGANGQAPSGAPHGFGPMWARQQGQAARGMGAGMGLGTLAPALRSGASAGVRGGAAWAGQPDEVQAFLGMTEEQIQAERQAGKSLVQIAAEKGKTRDALVSTILNAKKAILDQQVAAGKLTQAQADTVYANMQAQVTVMVDRTDVGPGCGTAAAAAAGQTAGTRMGMGGRWNR